MSGGEEGLHLQWQREQTLLWLRKLREGARKRARACIACIGSTAAIQGVQRSFTGPQGDPCDQLKHPVVLDLGYSAILPEQYVVTVVANQLQELS